MGTSHDGLAGYYAGNFDAKPKFPTAAWRRFPASHHRQRTTSAAFGGMELGVGPLGNAAPMHASRISDDGKKRFQLDGDPDACLNK